MQKGNERVNESFILSDKVSQYMSIFSKVYIGFISKEVLLTLINDESCEVNSKSKKFDKDYVFVTIDKKDDGTYYVVFYAKEIKGKLKKIEILPKEVKVSDKDQKGFTVAETKFISHSFKPFNQITLNNIKSIQARVLGWK